MIRRTPPKVPRPTPVRRVTHPEIAALGDPAAAQAFYQATAGRLPLVETVDDATVRVTFCWWDPDAVRVLLFVNRLTDETRLDDSLLSRVPGTALWHASYLVEPDWRASYCFLAERPGGESPLPSPPEPSGIRAEPSGIRAEPSGIRADQIRIRELLDRGEADPHNPDHSVNRAGIEQSVASGPHAPAQPWHRSRDGVRPGTFEAGEVDGRRVWWYAPATPAEHPTPLVVALDGEVWTSSHSLPTILDNLIADGLLPPTHAVLVDSGGRDQRWQELAGDDVAEYDAWLAGPLLDAARARLPVSESADETVIVGQSLGGLTALRVGLGFGDRFGLVASQSASLWQDDLSEVPHRGRARIHLAHGAQEWVLAPDHELLAVRLRAAGHEVLAPRYNGGHDYAWWRGAVGDAIVALLSPRDG
ncbi:enterochelin esterase domain-containing protein [Nocardioides sp. Bht2]|uniref:enterochelin esterase domain-containing protein n=1 Tax=Nocardioides sp. Bht2 TaxID=3392297 RepID=UPI0039B36A4A